MPAWRRRWRWHRTRPPISSSDAATRGEPTEGRKATQHKPVTRQNQARPMTIDCEADCAPDELGDPSEH